MRQRLPTEIDLEPRSTSGNAPLTALICLSLTHTMVDTCALLVGPLWPNVERAFSLSVWGLSLAFIVQSLPTSIVQSVFGYVRDRRPLPSLLWIGPVLAAVCLPLIGLFSSFGIFCLLLIVGGVGVGAFHPEAAVAAGRILPQQRTRGVSLFMFGGALGLGLGPALSGALAHYVGSAALAWLVGPLLLSIVALRRFGRFQALPRAPAPAHDSPSAPWVGVERVR